MGEHVGIGVSGQAMAVGDGDAAQDKFSVFSKTMGIIAMADTHFWQQILVQ